jgi:CubicO group peptidase (beta-lactamase class C family)
VQSCAKSFAGVLAEMLIEQGVLNEDVLIPDYLPEMTQTAWGDATLRQVMDMLIGMRFDENYADPDSEVWRYLRAGGMLPSVPGEPVEALCDYLETIPKEGEHGNSFAYREPNINILTWIIQRVTGKSLNELLSEMIWQHIGAEHDARYMIDPNGFCTTASCAMRDFLKFGELVRTGGDGVISQKVRDSIFGGGDVDKFALFKHPTMKNWSYRSQWWIRHQPAGNCAVARGAHGQFLYIDPANEIVIVRFGSQQEAPSHTHDDIIFPMIDAVTAQLSGN